MVNTGKKLENLDSYERRENWGNFNEENKGEKCWDEQSFKFKNSIILWQNVKIPSAHQICKQLKLKPGLQKT